MSKDGFRARKNRFAILRVTVIRSRNEINVIAYEAFDSAIFYLIPIADILNFLLKSTSAGRISNFDSIFEME